MAQGPCDWTETTRPARTMAQSGPVQQEYGATVIGVGAISGYCFDNYLQPCGRRVPGDEPGLTLAVASMGDAITGINRADTASEIRHGNIARTIGRRAGSVRRSETCSDRREPTLPDTGTARCPSPSAVHLRLVEPSCAESAPRRGTDSALTRARIHPGSPLARGNKKRAVPSGLNCKGESVPHRGTDYAPSRRFAVK